MPWLVTKDGRTVAHGRVGDVFHEIVVVGAKWAGDNESIWSGDVGTGSVGWEISG